MICPKCGQELPEGTKFCIYCGTQLELPTAPEEKVEKPVAQVETQPTAITEINKNNWIILSIGVLAIIILSLIGSGALCLLPSIFVGIFLGIKTASMFHPKNTFAKLVYSLIFPFAVFFIIFIVLTIPFELSGKSESITALSVGLFFVTTIVSIVYLIRMKVSE